MSSESLFWELAAELQAEDDRVVEGTIMNGRCLRVGKEFLALADFKGSGMVVKLPKARVADLIESGVGLPFAPAAATAGIDSSQGSAKEMPAARKTLRRVTWGGFIVSSLEERFAGHDCA